jgi:DNA-binding IclR family transcriptional regulator
MANNKRPVGVIYDQRVMLHVVHSSLSPCHVPNHSSQHGQPAHSSVPIHRMALGRAYVSHRVAIEVEKMLRSPTNQPSSRRE